MPVDEETKAALLDNLDVQRFLLVLNGVLTGTKKLVIESIAKHQIVPDTSQGGSRANGLVDYTHTFRVEDVDVTN